VYTGRNVNARAWAGGVFGEREQRAGISIAKFLFTKTLSPRGNGEFTEKKGDLSGRIDNRW
tara:strand:+ start:281 stop:463 length:183 start_codon:yes stop_codon:yes gene_type:complete